ncbi:hypothetical protein [Mailhella massiliensis]|uniref:hypothetical protein n=1 Tax=Mailhella massiliensis TaxID=1903261 RepID=UPI0011867086|nr:hypothetical protein [Mailhella massiliensis]
MNTAPPHGGTFRQGKGKAHGLTVCSRLLSAGTDKQQNQARKNAPRFGKNQRSFLGVPENTQKKISVAFTG